MDALIEAALPMAASAGAPALEAYPVDTSGTHLNPASLFPGTVGTFRAAGFQVVGSRLSQQGEPRPERPIVRLELGYNSLGDDDQDRVIDALLSWRR